jgi:hypothetical protein
MPATASNRKVLEDFIKNHYKAGAFNTCKKQHWLITAGPPMNIHTPPDAPRVYCRRPTKVPLHFREEVKTGLEADVKKGVLETVPVGEADTWCSSMVIQPKKNGGARRTVDLSGLSKAGRHESHQISCRDCQDGPSWQAEVHLGLRGRVPWRGAGQGGPPQDHLCHRMGSLPLPSCSTRISVFRRQLHQTHRCHP